MFSSRERERAAYDPVAFRFVAANDHPDHVSQAAVAVDVVQAANDKNQVEPMLKKIGALPAALGKAEHLLADTGYFGTDNMAAREKAGVEPGKRDGPTAASPAVERADAPKTPTPVEAMAHKQKTPAGRALCALRKQTPEPVFGVIKSVLGFRQFSMRGLEKARGEWSLATMAWNLKRMFALKAV